jgi:hypothetical protein
MKILALAVAAALFAVPALTPPAFAHHGKAKEHQEMAMTKKKKATKARKPAKQPKKKEEYMRAAPYR